ncbi:aldehyde dehydrogenase family protein [Lentibacter sp. XHP0401]|uniref:aldehyde dehydrogenase family protein n=1 Tax=Lentibacter sp. XHP0401 TaxID=2984334 RepID=UPI0021E7EB34|nr:aldehyde dehydrogenase family protein [Lentibacter sp. XHP0401]MCV2893082.1 aldehyde dehydrogenase family protein [Lentibacter sp. XHP0401]
MDGTWQEAAGEALEIRSPIDGQKLTTIERATVADVDRAVAAARRAFEDGRWRDMSPAGRKKVLHKIADLIEQYALELTVLGVRDNGTEFNMALKAEAGSAAGTFRYYAEAVDKIYGEVAPTAPDVLGLVHHAPVGVVGAIVPWNFPLMIGAWKLAPALATGNSVVLKPAETASLSLLRLAEICAEAGLPDGVLNVVTGQGSVTGEALAMSHGVDVLVFTGSGGVGRRLLEYSARSNLKRVYLELGGKSPNVVFADAPDLELAAKVSAMGIFRNSGQVCVAGSRLLVERSVHDEFVALLGAEAEKLKVGDPLDLGTHIGAVNSIPQLEGNLGFVEKALAEGAEVATGGERILEETGGYYMAPTILTGVEREHNVFQNEVFGPVLAVTAFDTDAEAVSLANGTDYGLSAGVWTSNLSRAHRMVHGIRAGIVHVNTYGGSDNTVPLGGVKQSGNGHDKSLHAIDKYVDLKTAWIQL